MVSYIRTNATIVFKSFDKLFDWLGEWKTKVKGSGSTGGTVLVTALAHGDRPEIKQRIGCKRHQKKEDRDAYAAVARLRDALEQLDPTLDYKAKKMGATRLVVADEQVVATLGDDDNTKFDKKLGDLSKYGDDDLQKKYDEVKALPRQRGIFRR